MLAKDLIHGQIVRHLASVRAWFEEKRRDLKYPVYTSYDIRDSGRKIAVVDANIFPAGFNNICQIDRDNAPQLMERYLNRHYGEATKDLLLLTEEHTQNAYYWENVHALEKIVRGAGRNVRIAIPRELDAPLTMKTVNGHELTVHSARRSGTGIRVDDFEPQLIISNNDFSDAYADWSEGLRMAMNPPRELGWYQRKKSGYFDEYNGAVREFADLIQVDPWLLTVATKSFSDFDLSVESKRDQLAEQVETMLAEIQEKYRQHGIEENPFLMVKNNSGTYGLGVIQVRSGDEVRNFTYKSRKKMKASKGGRGIEEVILQEGIPSAVSSDGVVAEPAIYLIGCELAGGFLRAHDKKGPQESLNSPGAVYKRLCVSDLRVSVEGHPMENVYGWIARLGLLAVGRETNRMKVEYVGYRNTEKNC